MTDDAGFLRTIAATPSDDLARLVYADFLDERGRDGDGARAEFLRLTARLAACDCKKAERKGGRARLQELAAGLDGEWLAVVSRLAVENCQSRGRSAPFNFSIICGRKWADLTPTDATAVRHCDGCREDVHYCDTIGEARRHAGLGHCVAVDLGIIRRDGDLQPARMLMGRMLPNSVGWQRELDRRAPDPVSAAREEARRHDSDASGGAAEPLD